MLLGHTTPSTAIQGLSRNEKKEGGSKGNVVGYGLRGSRVLKRHNASISRTQGAGADNDFIRFFISYWIARGGVCIKLR